VGIDWNLCIGVVWLRIGTIVSSFECSSFGFHRNWVDSVSEW
jgi:hypothetical protein